MIKIKIVFHFLSNKGHGRLLEPPGRSSYHLLRDDPEIDESLIVPNYNDNGLFCGGLQTQISNGYKCGVCGGKFYHYYLVFFK